MSRNKFMHERVASVVEINSDKNEIKILDIKLNEEGIFKVTPADQSILKSLSVADKINYKIVCSSKFPRTIQISNHYKSSSTIRSQTPSEPNCNGVKIIAKETTQEHDNIINLTSCTANHFYVVFNPYFNSREQELKEIFPGETQAHWFFKLLKYNIESKKIPYSYWGKLESKGRPSLDVQSYINHHQRNKIQNFDTHLYISDFKYLWVAKVESIHERLDKKELQHTLTFYKENADKVEIWFKISDLKMIASSRTETLAELSQLKETRSGTMLSPYECELRYPIVLKDNYETKHFSRHQEEVGRYVCDPNALLNRPEHGDTIKMALQNYVFPDSLFNELPNYIRSEIIFAESIYLDRAHESNPEEKNIKNQMMFIHYARVLECLLKKLTAKSAQDTFRFLVNNIPNLEGSKRRLLDQYKSIFTHDIVEVRNKLTHPDCSFKFDEKMLTTLRSGVLGIGMNGLINQIYNNENLKSLVFEAPNNLQKQLRNVG